jgi:hypothetical protein
MDIFAGGDTCDLPPFLSNTEIFSPGKTIKIQVYLKSHVILIVCFLWIVAWLWTQSKNIIVCLNKTCLVGSYSWYVIYFVAVKNCMVSVVMIYPPMSMDKINHKHLYLFCIRYGMRILALYSLSLGIGQRMILWIHEVASRLSLQQSYTPSLFPKEQLYLMNALKSIAYAETNAKWMQDSLTLWPKGIWSLCAGGNGLGKKASVIDITIGV